MDLQIPHSLKPDKQLQLTVLQLNTIQLNAKIDIIDINAYIAHHLNFTCQGESKTFQ